MSFTNYLSELEKLGRLPGTSLKYLPREYVFYTSASTQDLSRIVIDAGFEQNNLVDLIMTMFIHPSLLVSGYIPSDFIDGRIGQMWFMDKYKHLHLEDSAAAASENKVKLRYGSKFSYSTRGRKHDGKRPIIAAVTKSIMLELDAKRIDAFFVVSGLMIQDIEV